MGHYPLCPYVLVGKIGIWVGEVIDIVNCRWVECVGAWVVK